jgi:hypothetical protein
MVDDVMGEGEGTKEGESEESRPAEKYKVEMPKIQSEVQNDPLRIPIT